MDARHWLRELRSELRRHNLPPQYAERLVEELSDHLTDFTEDRMRKDALDLQLPTANLGMPSGLAAQAAEAYRSQHLVGRHPVWAFLVLPIAMLPLAWLTLGVLGYFLIDLVCLVPGCEKAITSSQPAMITLCVVIWGWLVILPAIAGAVVCCRMVQRAALDARWAIAACAALALTSGVWVVDIIPRTNNVPGTGQFIIDPRPWSHGFTTYQAAHMLAPLVVGMLLMVRHRNRSRLTDLPAIPAAG